MRSLHRAGARCSTFLRGSAWRWSELGAWETCGAPSVLLALPPPDCPSFLLLGNFWWLEASLWCWACPRQWVTSLRQGCTAGKGRLSSLWPDQCHAWHLEPAQDQCGLWWSHLHSQLWHLRLFTNCSPPLRYTPGSGEDSEQEKLLRPCPPGAPQKG